MDLKVERRNFYQNIVARPRDYTLRGTFYHHIAASPRDLIVEGRICIKILLRADFINIIIVASPVNLNVESFDSNGSLYSNIMAILKGLNIERNILSKYCGKPNGLNVKRHIFIKLLWQAQWTYILSQHGIEYGPSTVQEAASLCILRLR